jgi:hypothetical protein
MNTVYALALIELYGYSVQDVEWLMESASAVDVNVIDALRDEVETLASAYSLIDA